MIEKIVFFWQHLPQYINPVILRGNFFQIRWYGIMYTLSFLFTYRMILYRLNKEKIPIARSLIDDYFFWMILAVILGARLGYVFFYNFSYYLENPLEIFLPFDFKQGIRFIGISGMSYHGGLLGLILGTLFFCYKNRIDFWRLADLVAWAVPLGYTFGRIGNFLNLELYGRPTNFFLGMYFPTDPLRQLRHPSQLYEAFFEGIVLFLLLSFVSKKIKIKGMSFCFYILGYGILRFMIEYFRQPDIQLGFVLRYFTMGQLLCSFMVLAGILLLIFRYRRKEFYV
ncbi:MAG: prolipoprotein diacylglyceryl transferase [Candidatus Omnitrophica bacterium]|nr:prolipoprotein diacylglyceryl transferase [Candidatus Omnitrophota bacterium]